MTIQRIIENFKAYTIDDKPEINSLLTGDWYFDTDKTTPGICDPVEDTCAAFNALSEEDKSEVMNGSPDGLIGPHPPHAPGQ